MTAFPIDRAHPPRRIHYRDAERSLMLRPWSLDDVDLLTAAVASSAEALRVFMPWSHAIRTRETEYAIVAKFASNYWLGQEYVMGTFDDAGELLGCVGLHPRAPLNPRALEVGFWCVTKHAGKGWTTLACQVLVALCFDWFDCDRMQVIHDEANVASRRIAEKCGFSYEGTHRRITPEASAEVRAGGYRGTARYRMYAITIEDLGALTWLPAIRSGLTLIDALGGEPRIG